MRTIAFTLLIAVFALSMGVAGAETYVVDDDWEGADFRDLPEAIGNITHGDTLLVHEGMYNATRFTSYSYLTLKGNGTNATLVYGSRYEYMGLGTYSSIEGFYITNHLNYGIYIRDNCSITNCLIEDAGRGIYGYYSLDLTIKNCTVIGSRYDAITLQARSMVINTTVIGGDFGIEVTGSSMIEGCRISDCRIGIGTSYDSPRNVTIRDCYLVNNSQYGVYLASGTWDVDIVNVTVIKSENGFFIYGVGDLENCSVYNSSIGYNIYKSYSSVINSTAVNCTKFGVQAFEGSLVKNCSLWSCGFAYTTEYYWRAYAPNYYNCTVNGLPLTIYRDAHGLDVTGTHGQILMLNCTDVIIRDLEMADCSVPLIIYESVNVTIVNCTFRDLYVGMAVVASDRVNFSDLTIVNTTWLGFDVVYSDHVIVNNITSWNCPDTRIWAYNASLNGSAFSGGIDVTSGFSSYIHGWSITNTTVNGRPVLLATNKTGMEITGDYGQLILYNISDSVLYDMEFIGVDEAIMLSGSTNVVVSNVSMSSAIIGISLYHDKNITIIGSNFTDLTSPWAGSYSRRILVDNCSFNNISSFYSMYHNKASINGSAIDLSKFGSSSYYYRFTNCTLWNNDRLWNVYAHNSTIVLDIDADVNTSAIALRLIGNDNTLHEAQLTERSNGGMQIVLDGDRNIVQGINASGEDLEIDITGNGNLLIDCTFEFEVFRSSMYNTRVENCTINSSTSNRFTGAGTTFSNCTMQGGISFNIDYYSQDVDLVFDNVTMDGEPLVAYNGVDGLVLPADAKRVLLMNCTNVTISGLTEMIPGAAIYLFSCSNVLIEDLNISRNGRVLYAQYCEDVLVRNCNFSENIYALTFYRCERVRIRKNRFIDNTQASIDLTGVTDSSIIYNDLIDTDDQYWYRVDDDSDENLWSNNYWSHTKLEDRDGDGLSDKPFEYSRITDLSPLMRSFTEYDVLPTVGNDPPSITIYPESTSVAYPNLVKYYGFASDDRNKIEMVQIKIGSGDWTNATFYRSREKYAWQFELDTLNARSGWQKVQVRAFDGGNYSDPAVADIEIIDPYDIDEDITISGAVIVEAFYIVLFIIAFIIVVKRIRRKRENGDLHPKASPKGTPRVDKPVIAPSKPKKKFMKIEKSKTIKKVKRTKEGKK